MSESKQYFVMLNGKLYNVYETEDLAIHAGDKLYEEERRRSVVKVFHGERLLLQLP